MFARGLVEETRGLLQHGLAENKTAMQAIGYRQVVEHLRGERPLAETIELVKSRTRQFAKRQLTWFRRQGNLEWIELKPDESLERMCAKNRPEIFNIAEQRTIIAHDKTLAKSSKEIHHLTRTNPSAAA